MCKLLTRFCRDQSGVTAVEYGILGTMVGLAIIISLEVLGISFSGTIQASADKINTAAGE